MERTEDGIVTISVENPSFKKEDMAVVRGDFNTIAGVDAEGRIWITSHF